MSQTDILYSTEGTVAILQFNRVDKKNAITANMYDLLADGIINAEADDSVKVIKIIGDHTAFCAGNDLQDFVDNPPENEDAPVWKFLKAISGATKPIIAGVNGPAVGIGTTMLLHCDLVVASDTAIFTMPFSSLGLCPEAASSLLVPMQCGMKKASQWLLLSERFNAETAKASGLINEAVAIPEEVDEVLAKWEKKLSALSLDSLVTTKKLLKAAQKDLVAHQIEVEGKEFNRLVKSDEAQAAFNAFLKK